MYLDIYIYFLLYAEKVEYGSNLLAEQSICFDPQFKPD